MCPCWVWDEQETQATPELSVIPVPVTATCSSFLWMGLLPLLISPVIVSAQLWFFLLATSACTWLWLTWPSGALLFPVAHPHDGHGSWTSALAGSLRVLCCKFAGRIGLAQLILLC